MKLTHKLAGAFLGAIQGFFVLPVVKFIIIWNDIYAKHFPFRKTLTQLDYLLQFTRNHNSIKAAFRNREWSTAIELLIVYPFRMLISIIFSITYLLSILLKLCIYPILIPILNCSFLEGIFEGAVIGFDGGIVSSGDKKIPIYHLYDVLRTIRCDDYVENIDILATQYYLARKYQGFAPYSSSDTPIYVIKDMLDIPEQAKIVNEFLKICSSRPEFRRNDLPRKLELITTFPDFVRVEDLAGWAYAQYMCMENLTPDESSIIKKLFQVLFTSYFKLEDLPVWTTYVKVNELKMKEITTLYREFKFPLQHAHALIIERLNGRVLDRKESPAEKFLRVGGPNLVFYITTFLNPAPLIANNMEAVEEIADITLPTLGG